MIKIIKFRLEDNKIKGRKPTEEKIMESINKS